MARTNRFSTEDDDPNDCFYANGLLKDGRVFRVRMQMRDSAQDTIARAGGHTPRFTDSRSLVTDGYGGTDGLNRPGYRLAVGDAGADAKQRAYDEYSASLNDASRTPTRDAAGETNEGTIEGSSCMVKSARFPGAFGAPGTLKRIDGALVCVPAAPDAPKSKSSADGLISSDERQRQYEIYDRVISEQWKGPSR